MPVMNLYAIAGIGYDIVGAALLVQAIARTHDDVLVQQSQHRQFSGGNLEMFEALERQRHDAWFGLALLVAGFILQLFAAIGFALTVSWLSSAILLGSLIAVLVWWRVAARRLATTAGTRFAACLTGMDLANFLRLHPEVPRPADMTERIFGSGSASSDPGSRSEPRQ